MDGWFGGLGGLKEGGWFESGWVVWRVGWFGGWVRFSAGVRLVVWCRG